MKLELILGSGKTIEKRMRWEDSPNEVFENPTCLDIQEPADVIHDLNDPILPFADDAFDEIHAYEILEHVGSQGDWRFFFAQFAEFHRVLKPGGHMCITCPMWDSHWSYGDPGHTRVLPKECFAFLTAEHYEQVGKSGSSCSDYRAALGDALWELRGIQESQHQLFVVLKSV